jgi:hypothetical protein
MGHRHEDGLATGPPTSYERRDGPDIVVNRTVEESIVTEADAAQFAVGRHSLRYLWVSASGVYLGRYPQFGRVDATW